MRVSPLLVGGLLVVGATIGLAIGIAMSVRARRRDLGMLRVLGFTSRQLRGSVLVQAVASVTGGVVIGVPVGVVLVSAAWRAFASQLGVATEPSTPVAWIVATAVGAIVIALVAAALPARATPGRTRSRSCWQRTPDATRWKNRAWFERAGTAIGRTPLEIVDAELAPPGAGHVRVVLAATPTSRSPTRLPLPGVPIVLGHRRGRRGAAEVGPEVDGLAA